jgi:hypothetical protein
MIAENGFPKAAKSVREQVIKNEFHVTTNEPMKPCPYIIRI